MTKKKAGRAIKTLADCIMDGGIRDKYFRDINNDYNQSMEFDERSKAEGSLYTSRKVFPRSINRPPYEIISLDANTIGHNMEVKVYLKGIEDRRHVREALFDFRGHLSDELYE